MIVFMPSMAGDQLQAPPSPRDGDDAPIHVERPQVCIIGICCALAEYLVFS